MDIFFRDLAAGGPPSIFLYGCSKSEKIAKYFNNLMGKKISAINILKNDNKNKILRNLKLLDRVICLDAHSTVHMSNVESKINFCFSDPYQNKGNFSYGEVHEAYSNSHLTLCASEVLRSKIQSRYSKVIKLIPDLPLSLTKEVKVDEECTILIILAEKSDYQLALSLLRATKNNNALIACRDNLTRYEFSTSNFSRIQWCSIKTELVVYIGNPEEKIPPLRVIDHVANDIPILAIENQNDKSLLPKNVLGSINKSLDELHSLNSGIHLIKKIQEDPSFLKTILFEQRRLFTPTYEAAGWLKELGSMI